MSNRLQMLRHLAALKDIGGIMGAMKNMSLIECHKLASLLEQQHRVLASIEEVGCDLLAHHPEIADRAKASSAQVLLVIGSQRGFCGDFNDSLARALRQYWQDLGDQPAPAMIIGRRLAAKLGTEPRIFASFDGPSVVEEAQPVLQRVMEALVERQQQEGRERMLSVTVLAHRDGEIALSARCIFPLSYPLSSKPRYATQPRTNMPTSALFTQLAHHYLWAQMHDVFYSSLMAENRRRLQHMEGALQRMDEKVQTMQRQFNVLRQEEITEEIEVIMLSNVSTLDSKHAKSNPS